MANLLAYYNDCSRAVDQGPVNVIDNLLIDIRGTMADETVQFDCGYRAQLNRNVVSRSNLVDSETSKLLGELNVVCRSSKGDVVEVPLSKILVPDATLKDSESALTRARLSNEQNTPNYAPVAAELENIVKTREDPKYPRLIKHEPYGTFSVPKISPSK